jgi:glycosyltransferase involved in cell wall biosynthesis
MKAMNEEKRRILLLPGAYNSPAARFRIWQFVEPLQKAGYDVRIRVPFPDRENKIRSGKVLRLPSRLNSVLRIITAWWITRDAHRFFAVITNRDIVPELRVTFLEKRMIRKGAKLIFDFDDAIHLGAREAKLKNFLPDCAYVAGGNPMLRDYGLTLNSRTILLPTVVNTNYYKPTSQADNKVIRIGWSGSASTNKHCLPLLKEPIMALAKELNFEFVVISNEDPDIEWEGVHHQFIKWKAEQEVEQLQTFDIGLMPLNDNEFERGKCGLKAIQYMALGIPALVSPVGVNAEIVEHGLSGYHCVSVNDWKQYILKLSSDKTLRIEMGNRARQRVEAGYSVEYALTLWLKVFHLI